mmetsp:Transcript_18468/g.58962  ORF Transcript_18468/g.58962 Transcript_18468/m.58962 type:complete len:266 (-) Transcript_18468:998-1795(-)
MADRGRRQRSDRRDRAHAMRSLRQRRPELGAAARELRQPVDAAEQRSRGGHAAGFGARGRADREEHAILFVNVGARAERLGHRRAREVAGAPAAHVGAARAGEQWRGCGQGHSRGEGGWRLVALSLPLILLILLILLLVLLVLVLLLLEQWPRRESAPLRRGAGPLRRGHSPHTGPGPLGRFGQRGQCGWLQQGKHHLLARDHPGSHQPVQHTPRRERQRASHERCYRQGGSLRVAPSELQRVHHARSISNFGAPHCRAQHHQSC